MKQLQFNLKIEPTKQQICGMCHCSSGCEKCCNVCKKEGKWCNSSQHCMLNKDRQIDRLEGWLNIVKTYNFYFKFKKYFFYGDL